MRKGSALGAQLVLLANKWSFCRQFSSLGSQLEAVEQWCRHRPSVQTTAEQRRFLDPWAREAIWDNNRSSKLDIQNCYHLCNGGRLSEAVEALELLVSQQFCLPVAVLYYVLKTCIAHKDLPSGRSVHALTRRIGYESNSFLACHLIRMYACTGRLQEAMQVFREVHAPNLSLWGFIIAAHAEHMQHTEVLKLYEQMRQMGVKPNEVMYVTVLKACASTADVDFGREVHADIDRSGAEINVFVGSSLVDMYAKSGSLQDARRVFDGLTTKNAVTWSAMLGGYAQHGLGQETLALFAAGQKGGMIHESSFVILVNACATVEDLHQGQQLHSEICRRGLETDTYVGTSLVGMYIKCGSLEAARRVFDRLPEKNVVTWNTMITGYSQRGLCQQALSLFKSMQREGISPADNFTFTSLLKACASVGALHEGRKLHLLIQETGLQNDLIVGNSLVDMYVKCGSLDDARRVFDRLPGKDVVTWTALMAGYAQHGLGQEALSLYAGMQEEASTPANRATFACLLKACTSIGALHQGRLLHCQIQARGLEDDPVVSCSLVDMYAKCGSLDDARTVLDRLAIRNVCTWNALLHGYAQHDQGRMAIQSFQEMLHQMVVPDDATFLCLLLACSHEGLVTEGEQFFKMMEEDHAITPRIHHYNCMADLLGRSGRLAEAESMLQTLPSNKDTAGWKSLLSACNSHGDMERGRRCFDHLIKVEPQDAAPYALLASIYAKAGRWRDVDRIENLRKSAGACKKAARSWIEVASKVHMFVVGEGRDDIHSKLRNANQQLSREREQFSQSSLVLKPVPDAGEEDALCGHAEKLALAYGLLNTPDGTTLLVTKNLRMCNDCHNGTKIMSRIERREIIVRDAHRVHHFVDGFCSCGDRN